MSSPPKTLRLVALEESHLAAILEIEKLSNSSPWSEKSFRNELDHPHGIFLVAMLDGQVAGYGGVWLVIDEAHITTVAVAPEHRRKGIGQAIMKGLLERAAERGATCSTLEVRAGNAEAIAMYERLGYAKSAVRKRYYPDNREDALVMWRYD
jgi:ribosomal-protein-alanine N-acetyltransferase